jgi:hypothetical protein
METIVLNADKIGGKLLKFQDGKEYVCIPFDSDFMQKFIRKGGGTGISINIVKIDLKEPKKSDFNDKFEDIAFIKPNIKKEAFEKYSEEVKKSIPICGNVSRFSKSEVKTETINQTFDDSKIPLEEKKENDLPF